MSTRRRKAGVDGSAMRRGPNGRPLCRWCKAEVAGRRRTFCSAACVHEWKVRRDPSYVRTCLRRRDDGICSECGLDAVALYYELRLLDRLALREGKGPGVYLKALEQRKIPLLRMANENGLWDADHVVGVADGGGECSLDGFQTLCLWCHRKRSAGQTTARAARRKS